MQLRLLNFSSLVQHMAAATQAASAQLLDLTIGSVLRALLEANAGMALWLQWLIARVLNNTRAATSAGEDLDSWMADFSVYRLQATAALGLVKFSRLTSGLLAHIPVGGLVKTADGAQAYGVVADTDHVAFNAVTQTYALAETADFIDLPVQATLPGMPGNAQAGAIRLLATAIPGVDSVTNIAAMHGGLDAEPDNALRARFQSFMDTRARATARAIGYAIGQVQQGLAHLILENTDVAGNYRPGNFLIVVDDGSGAPSNALIARVTTAVEDVRPIGSSFAVRPPAVVPVDISVTLTLSTGATLADVSAAVGSAIALYANALPIGAALTRSRIAQLAHDADNAVLNAGTILLNGSNSDITPTARSVLKPRTIVVS